MQADTAVVRRHPSVSYYPEWPLIKAWVRKTFTTGRMAVVILTVSTMTILGMVISSLTLNRWVDSHAFCLLVLRCNQYLQTMANRKLKGLLDLVK